MMTDASYDLAANLISKYGPTLGGSELYASLGFKTYASFHRSRLRGELGVNVFKLSGRRGWFALTNDVANWLNEQANKSDIF